MRHNELLNTLQNLIDKGELAKMPNQTQLGMMLDLPQNAISGRKTRNSNYSDEEIRQIENFLGLRILGNNANDCIELDFYPNVFGSCGNGSMIFDESSEKISITKEVIDNYSSSNQYSVISARGSSMSPVINDDDRLVVQKHNGEQIIDNAIYLFRYNDELFIKRLVKNIDQVVCISENPRFEDRVIDPAKCEFSIVGKIVGLFRNKV